jgi:hypothetical protein
MFQAARTIAMVEPSIKNTQNTGTHADYVEVNAAGLEAVNLGLSLASPRISSVLFKRHLQDRV